MIGYLELTMHRVLFSNIIQTTSQSFCLVKVKSYAFNYVNHASVKVHKQLFFKL